MKNQTLSRHVLSLLEKRNDEFERTKAKYELMRNHPINFVDNKPIAIMFIGDAHVDDPGTDTALLMKHLELTKTEGVYAINIGDLSNNWIGRLMSQYKDQECTEEQAIDLIDMILDYNWLGIVGGNHDKWSTLLAYGCKIRNILFNYNMLRLSLKFPNEKVVRAHIRHNFPGSSQYNYAHGQTKSKLKDHLIVGGHKHFSGINMNVDPMTGTIMYCLQIESYKKYDSYQVEQGFDTNFISPCWTAIIDPMAKTELELIKIDPEPERALKWLKMLREG